MGGFLVGDLGFFDATGSLLSSMSCILDSAADFLGELMGALDSSCTLSLRLSLLLVFLGSTGFSGFSNYSTTS